MRFRSQEAISVVRCALYNAASHSFRVNRCAPRNSNKIPRNSRYRRPRSHPLPRGSAPASKFHSREILSRTFRERDAERIKAPCSLCRGEHKRVYGIFESRKGEGRADGREGEVAAPEGIYGFDVSHSGHRESPTLTHTCTLSLTLALSVCLSLTLSFFLLSARAVIEPVKSHEKSKREL